MWLNWTKIWRLLLFASIFIGPSLCCIPCDPNGKAAMERFKNFFQIQTNWTEDVEANTTIQDLAIMAERTILDFLQGEAVIMDAYTLSQIVCEYNQTVNTIQALEDKENNISLSIEVEFQQLLERIIPIVKDMEKRRCPNKQGEDSCGLMVQTYIACDTCDVEKVVCAGGPPENQEYFDNCSCVCVDDKCFDLKTGLSCSPCPDLASHLAETLNCGVENIEITEGEDITLDCSLEWYTSLEDSYKNLFMEENDTEPVIPGVPYVDIKGAKMDDAGRYTCATILTSGLPVSNMTYNVTVVKASEGTMEGHQVTTEHPLPEFPENLNLIIRAMTLAGAATLCLVCCTCGILFYWRNIQRGRANIDPL